MQDRFAYRLVVLSLLALLYVGLIQKYRAYDIDNAWFSSYSYNPCHEGIDTDEFGRCVIRMGWTAFISSANWRQGLNALCWIGLDGHHGRR